MVLAVYQIDSTATRFCFAYAMKTYHGILIISRLNSLNNQLNKYTIKQGVRDSSILSNKSYNILLNNSHWTGHNNTIVTSKP